MRILLGVAALACLAAPAVGQNRYGPIPAAVSTQLPPGISVRKTLAGEVYVDAQGRVLYGMDTNTLRLDTRTPFMHCDAKCQESWEPMAPPPGTPETPATPLGFAQGFGLGLGGGGGGQARAADARAGQAGVQAGNFIGSQGSAQRGGPAMPSGPDWTVSEGPNGPQLVYKRVHLVFARKDPRADTPAWDGADNFRWNALRYVPPAPKIVAPAGVEPLFIGGEYVLVDKTLRVLFTRDSMPDCGTACAVPFLAGFARKDVGEWTVARSGDMSQWLYRGKPVYISREAPRVAAIPAGGAIMRP